MKAKNDIISYGIFLIRVMMSIDLIKDMIGWKDSHIIFEFVYHSDFIKKII
jgi:hypothetical protein